MVNFGGQLNAANSDVGALLLGWAAQSSSHEILHRWVGRDSAHDVVQVLLLGEAKLGRQDNVGAGMKSQSHLCSLDQSSNQIWETTQELDPLVES